MFTSPFGSDISYVVVTEDDLSSFELSPAERAILGENVLPKRVTEFSLGRAAAQIALAGLGLNPPPPVLRGKQREPLWPQGIVGSITHAGGYGICAVTRDNIALGIGIDLQSLSTLRNPGLGSRICRPEELSWINEGADRQGRLLTLFSARESIYKAFYSTTKYILGFKDVLLSWDERQQLLHGKLLVNINTKYSFGYSFQVGVKVNDKFVLTSLLLVV